MSQNNVIPINQTKLNQEEFDFIIQYRLLKPECKAGMRALASAAKEYATGNHVDFLAFMTER